jgi:hypothetical protein
MAGLDPAIHAVTMRRARFERPERRTSDIRRDLKRKGVDRRVKPGDDGGRTCRRDLASPPVMAGLDPAIHAVKPRQTPNPIPRASVTIGPPPSAIATHAAIRTQPLVRNRTNLGKTPASLAGRITPP